MGLIGCTTFPIYTAVDPVLSFRWATRDLSSSVKSLELFTRLSNVAASSLFCFSTASSFSYSLACSFCWYSRFSFSSLTLRALSSAASYCLWTFEWLSSHFAKNSIGILGFVRYVTAIPMAITSPTSGLLRYSASSRGFDMCRL